MKCECGTAMGVIDSRKIEQGVWRRRSCPACGATCTTLEQRCGTLARPYRDAKTGEVSGAVVSATPPPAVTRPKVVRPPSPNGKFHPAPADFAPPPEPKSHHAPLTNRPPVDRNEPSARDRIADMKADRETTGYGWE